MEEATMATATRRVGGYRVANPLESLEIVFAQAKYLIRLRRAPDGEFAAAAEFPRSNATLNVVGIISEVEPTRPRLVAEIGIGHTRPYGAVKGTPSGPLTLPRSREAIAVPTQAWVVIAPSILECLRDVVATRIETRYEIKGLFRRRQLVLRFNGDGGSQSRVAQDGRDAAFAGVPWRGVRVSVAFTDPVLVELFHSFELVCNSEIGDRLFAFGSVLHRLVNGYQRERTEEDVPANLRSFLSRPGQEYFYRPHILLELCRLESRTPRFELHRIPKTRRRRLKSGKFSQTTVYKKQWRRRYGEPLLGYPDTTLDLLVQAGCVSNADVEVVNRLRKDHRDGRNPLAPFLGKDLGFYRQDVEVRYASGRRGPRSDWRPGPRRRRWHPPSYLVFDARLAPAQHERILTSRRVDADLFSDIDRIIAGSEARG